MGPYRLQEEKAGPRPRKVLWGQEPLPGSLHGYWWGSHPCSRWTETGVTHWLPSGPTRGLGTEGLATQRRYSASKTQMVFCSSPASLHLPWLRTG